MMNITLLIFLMMCTTFISRLIPALFIDKMNITPKIEKFLKLIPYTAMTALVIPGIFSIDQNISVGLIAGIVSVLVAWRRLPTMAIVVISIAVVYIMTVI